MSDANLELYFNGKDLTGLQYALRDAGLPFRDNGSDLLGRACLIRCQVPNEDDTVKRHADLHVCVARIESLDLDQGAEALVFEISRSTFAEERCVRSLNFDLRQRKWFLRVGDDAYADPDIYPCEFTLL